MLSYRPLIPGTALFLFAHQDDEFGVFQKIIDEQRCGHRVVCAYLTDGVFRGKSSLRRNLESISVLTRLGVKENDILFVGNTLSIADGSLAVHLDRAGEWLLNWLTDRNIVASIYLPAWEGGHHDHDALHAMGVMVACKTGHLELMKQYALYNAYRCVSPFFRVLLPMRMNGEPQVTKIPWPNRFRFLRYCLSYPSQCSTWIGLFPFVLLHFLFSGNQTVQPVSSERILQRPHSGSLYYENRNFYTWEEMNSSLIALEEWLSNRLGNYNE